MPISRQDAQTRARLAALTKIAKTPNRSALTAASRASQAQKFVDEVRAALPDLTDEGEIQRRADELRRAHMLRLALRSSTVRRRRRGLADEQRRIDRELAAAVSADAVPDDGE